MKKGIYLVTEPACFNPHTGAYRHIQEGVNQLEVTYSITIVDDGRFSPEPAPDNKESSASKTFVKRIKESLVYGTMRDIKTLIKKQRRYRSLRNKIEALSPDFIYERANYLDSRGLRIAKELNIPHYFEVNGLQYLAHSKYYRSVINSLYKKREAKLYEQSNFVFYIGAWGDIFNSKKNNWTQIENGVEEKYVSANIELEKNIKGKLKICFVGFVMPHHRIERLFDELSKLYQPSKFELHLVSGNFSLEDVNFSSEVECFSYPFMSRRDLMNFLSDMHVGVLLGGGDYPSHMKVYDYGASKCIVLSPELLNMQRVFPHEVIYYSEQEGNALHDKLNMIESKRSIINKKGEEFFNKISEDYTWERIFSKVIDLMEKSA